jgi:hypothetical protein
VAFVGDPIKGISAHSRWKAVMGERGYDRLPRHNTDHPRPLDEILDIMAPTATRQRTAMTWRRGWTRGSPAISRLMTRGRTRRWGSIRTDRQRGRSSRAGNR